ncbi:MAG: hypothetical protein K2X91_09505, partial [Thermoleophilia bacterium]|nr:hypothetical protein [Thermoleophilia bacterium]
MKVMPAHVSMRHLLALVVASGAILGAWRFRDENRDVDRALASLQLQAFARGDGIERLVAISTLGDVKPAERPMAVDGLLAALEDPDPKLRVAATNALQAAFRKADPAGTDADVRRADIDRAMAGLVRALGDRDAQVRA